MMENMKITKENYEAYYLDALDGNLSEEGHALLQAFLMDHPELEVDMEDFPQLEPLNTHELPSDFLGALKQVDFANDTITDDNAEQFCIAANEGLLSADKQAELQRFVLKHKAWEKVYKTYTQVKLQPRKTEVYPNPAALKRSQRKLIPWYYSVGAAAALVVAFLMYQFSGKDVLKNTSTQTIATQQKGTPDKSAQNKVEQSKHATLKRQNIQAPIDTQRKEKELRVHDVDPFDPADDHSQVPMLSQQNMENNLKEDSLSVAYLPERYLHRPNGLPVTHALPVGVNVPAAKSNDLVNPIFPVTNALSAVLNTEIDFRKTRNTDTDNRGFYVKIGKFEVSRNARR
jgi:hypothetical protein